MKYQIPLMGRIRQIHFVGIGGAGMSGIAEVLLNLGYQISGSDKGDSSVVDRLRAQGVVVYLGHAASHVAQADVVVVSSAVADDNPEIIAAKQQAIPVIPRAEMLGELMRFRHGIAIAGTHGKSTTTGMLASLLAEAGWDPTFIIGGLLNNAGSNARLGTGHYLVAEADESDASFLYLKPMMAVVTNIDNDHLATYGNDFDRLRQTFVEFIHHLPFYGLAVLCKDDPVLQDIVPQLGRPLCQYGFDREADVSASDYRLTQMQSQFYVHRKNAADLEITLNVPGKHNALNALAAIAIATELRVPDSVICSGLAKFTGIGRRFQVYGEFDIGRGQVKLIDDYGHHPTEVAATIKTVREVWPDRRLVMAYQPHRYTRTYDLMHDFVDVLSLVDVLLLLEVYSAGESVIPGADGQSLFNHIAAKKLTQPVFISEKNELNQHLSAVLQDGDILLMQGAGDIGKIAAQLAVLYSKIT